MIILETIPILKQPGAYISLLLFSLAGTGLVLIFAQYCFKYINDVAGAILTILGTIGTIIVIVSLILSIKEPKIDTGRKQYIVKITENTSINDIYENYKIVDHTKYTDIYVLEDLEND